MTGPRLSLALAEGGLTLPTSGRIAVFAPRQDHDLSMLPQDRVDLIITQKPDFDAFEARGWSCVTEPQGRYGAALVVLPRAKALGHGHIAVAAALTDGPVILDGAKTDGIDSLLRACRKRTDVSAPISKAHGKLFWFIATDAFRDWVAQPQKPGGFVTWPGVFSADGIDPASAYLVDHLPPRLGARVADLGAGWGYLSSKLVERPDLVTLDLVESDYLAVTCARENVTDPRARFHWADATTWQGDALLDAVVMNPPFHIGRKAEPDLGRAFIKAASRLLRPSGQLWLVANRHLGYEETLAAHFTRVEQIASTTRFKILHGSKPSRSGR